MTVNLNAHLVRTAVYSGAEPFYQPIRMLKHSSLKYEALGRLNYRGFILTPNQFLPLLEGTPYLERFDHAILKRVVAQIAEWDAEGRVIDVSVNASAESLESNGYAYHVEELLAEHEVSPKQLTIEIVETCTFWKSERVLSTLSRLQALGVGIAIDDFPCWSDPEGLLTWLEQGVVGITSLKLDRSLVRSACDCEVSKVGLRQLVRFTKAAHRMNLSVVAEGVENDADAAKMRVCGVDSLQGYGIGIPQPAYRTHHRTESGIRMSIPPRELQKGEAVCSLH